jgi:hypothetical protein
MTEPRGQVCALTGKEGAARSGARRAPKRRGVRARERAGREGEFLALIATTNDNLSNLDVHWHRVNAVSSGYSSDRNTKLANEQSPTTPKAVLARLHRQTVHISGRRTDPS